MAAATGRATASARSQFDRLARSGAGAYVSAPPRQRPRAPGPPRSFRSRPSRTQTPTAEFPKQHRFDVLTESVGLCENQQRAGGPPKEGYCEDDVEGEL